MLASGVVLQTVLVKKALVCGASVSNQELLHESWSGSNKKKVEGGGGGEKMRPDETGSVTLVNKAYLV